MAYSELIKNFERVRDYMRQFYVYGFKSRGEYDAKSTRSYDNERRRIESWLGDYMSFRQEAAGKNVFLSVDSRAIPHNPLYNALKAKSFTDGDITFHFIIMDILAGGEQLSVREIVDRVAEKYLSMFDDAEALDESSIRKKLREYESLGLLTCGKRGRELVYSRTTDDIALDSWKDAVAFFSEEAPLGVVGSFLLDKFDEQPAYYGFKHHYILHALDSEVLGNILLAINEKRAIALTVHSQRIGNIEKEHVIYPLKIYVSTQSGRQYVLGWHYRLKKPIFFRIDSIRSAVPGTVESKANKYSEWYERFKENLWGVSTGAGHSLDHIEMTIHVGVGESYIIDRLEREKRCGRIETLDEQVYKYVADVYDASEMLPWLRTFIGRIKKLECSNQYVTDTFFADLDAMNALYGGDGDAV